MRHDDDQVTVAVAVAGAVRFMNVEATRREVTVTGTAWRRRAASAAEERRHFCTI